MQDPVALALVEEATGSWSFSPWSAPELECLASLLDRRRGTAEVLSGAGVENVASAAGTSDDAALDFDRPVLLFALCCEFDDDDLRTFEGEESLSFFFRFLWSLFSVLCDFEPLTLCLVFTGLIRPALADAAGSLPLLLFFASFERLVEGLLLDSAQSEDGFALEWFTFDKVRLSADFDAEARLLVPCFKVSLTSLSLAEWSNSPLDEHDILALLGTTTMSDLLLVTSCRTRLVFAPDSLSSEAERADFLSAFINCPS